LPFDKLRVTKKCHAELYYSEPFGRLRAGFLIVMVSDVTVSLSNCEP